MRIGINIFIGVLFTIFLYFGYKAYTELADIKEFMISEFDASFSSENAPSKKMETLFLFFFFTVVSLLGALILSLSRSLISGIDKSVQENVAQMIDPDAKTKIEIHEELKEEADDNHFNFVEEKKALFIEDIKDISLGETKLLLNACVKVLEGCVGIYYVPIMDDESLLAQETYAYTFENEVDKMLSITEGLVAQAIRNKKVLLVRDVPDGYITSVSGLGESTPNSIIIIPVFEDDRLVGAMEIATFKKIDKYCEELANAISPIIEEYLMF